ncbi:hypothetical protein NHX12_007466 [Muraenolepis orangiensis]|uniref:Macro domain-containing protein n=1 Tax=Muraenolepis orangiensis TaxID=630683 RepID=A0A9Q0DMX8_9TELE|nr:hypothetical protein NHX12_007466 [Muraenolepis orangiensis]
MDPLGARSRFVDIQTLPTWEQQQQPEPPDQEEFNDSLVSQQSFPSPFPFRPDINRKIVLLDLKEALLNCTAVVNTSNESLSDKNPVSESILHHAGPELRDELLKVKGCRTGEAKVTKGFNLAAWFIIHTVGPKYKTKEQSMASVGLCVVSTVKRGYPLEDATHIAFRTVRRFLENHVEAAETVVFAVSEVEEPVYRKLLPLYFPRSEEEERARLPFIPADIGNSEGEPIVPERQIRITEKPGNLQEEDSLDQDFAQVGQHAFSRMEGDVDKQRRLILQGHLSDAAMQKQHQRNYNRWLGRARAEDLSDIAALKALYQTGVDLWGRTVVVVIGRNIPVSIIDLEKALLYFIHVMDHVAVKEYVMVYFHTLTAEHNHLDTDFLKKLYDIVDAKFKKNLRAFYFVHPTLRAKEKVHYLDSLRQLLACMRPEQIDIPPFVLDYDARVNGPYNPSQSSAL